MKNFQLALMVLFLSLLACKKETSDAEPSVNNEVNFADLKVGQESHFELFNAPCDQAATFGTDTLVLTVTESNSGLALKESFTEGSPSYGISEPVTYAVIDQGSYLLLPERWSSNLFFFYGNDTLWKNPFVEVELSKEGCFLAHPDGSFFVGDEIGHIAHFDLDTHVKSDLKVVSCVPFFTLDAYLLYNRNGLEVSYYIQEGLPGFSTIIGWSKLH